MLKNQTFGQAVEALKQGKIFYDGPSSRLSSKEIHQLYQPSYVDPVEPLITKTKNHSTVEEQTHAQRVVFSYLQNKDAVKELFGTIAEKVADRPGGYTRILKLGNRIGDNAEVAFIELVDFNENMLKVSSKGEVKKARRSRKKKSEASESSSAE